MLVVGLLPLIAAFTLCGLILLSLVQKDFVFWPPPSGKNWQYPVFITLFRIVVYGLVILTAHHFLTQGTWAPTGQLLFGAALVVTGFAGGFIATFGLGWKNAFGTKEGLRTDGLFRFSRNPIYVATWVGMAGWALIAPTPLIVTSLSFWALGYLLAIFAEEQWLRREYGDAFDLYCQQVPRFFSLGPSNIP